MKLNITELRRDNWTRVIGLTVERRRVKTEITLGIPHNFSQYQTEKHNNGKTTFYLWLSCLTCGCEFPSRSRDIEFHLKTHDFPYAHKAVKVIKDFLCPTRWITSEQLGNENTDLLFIISKWKKEQRQTAKTQDELFNFYREVLYGYDLSPQQVANITRYVWGLSNEEMEKAYPFSRPNATIRADVEALHFREKA